MLTECSDRGPGFQVQSHLPSTAAVYLMQSNVHINNFICCAMILSKIIENWMCVYMHMTLISCVCRQIFALLLNPTGIWHDLEEATPHGLSPTCLHTDLIGNSNCPLIVICKEYGIQHKQGLCIMKFARHCGDPTGKSSAPWIHLHLPHYIFGCQYAGSPDIYVPTHTRSLMHEVPLVSCTYMLLDIHARALLGPYEPTHPWTLLCRVPWGLGTYTSLGIHVEAHGTSVSISPYVSLCLSPGVLSNSKSSI